MDHIKELALARMARGFVDRTRFHYGIDGDGTDLDGHAPHRAKHVGTVAVYCDPDASGDLAWSQPGFKGVRLLGGKYSDDGPNGSNGKPRQNAQPEADLETIEVVELLPSSSELVADVKVTRRDIEITTKSHIVQAWITGDLKAGMALLEKLLQWMMETGYQVFLNGAQLIPLAGGEVLESTELSSGGSQINHHRIVWINTAGTDTYEILTHAYRHIVRVDVDGLDAFCERLVAAGFYITVDRERYIPPAQRAARQAELDRLAAATDGPPPERIAVGGKRRRFGSRSKGVAGESAK